MEALQEEFNDNEGFVCLALSEFKQGAQERDLHKRVGAIRQRPFDFGIFHRMLKKLEERDIITSLPVIGAAAKQGRIFVLTEKGGELLEKWQKKQE